MSLLVVTILTWVEIYRFISRPRNNYSRWKNYEQLLPNVSQFWQEFVPEQLPVIVPMLFRHEFSPEQEPADIVPWLFLHAPVPSHVDDDPPWIVPELFSQAKLDPLQAFCWIIPEFDGHASCWLQDFWFAPETPMYPEFFEHAFFPSQDWSTM